jgi:uncharacterized membrane protein
MIAVPSAVGTIGWLHDNFAAALAYVTFIPAIIFLLRKPYKSNHFVRFHSLQSIFLAGAAVVVGVVLRIVFDLVALIPGAGYLLASLVVLVTCVGWVILWLVVVIKALQGEFFRVPIIGHFAEKV